MSSFPAGRLIFKLSSPTQNRQKIKEYDTLLNYNIENDILPDYCPVFKNVLHLVTVLR